MRSFLSNLWRWITSGRKPQPPAGPDRPDQGASVAEHLFRLHNQHRLSLGLPALSFDDRLAKAAQRHADTMSAFQHMSHSAGGTTFQRRVRDAGYLMSKGGENIAAGQRTAEQAVNSWMDSSGHRRNILAPWRHVGFGVSQGDDGRLYWCAVFATPSYRSGDSVEEIQTPEGIEHG